jgi:uncharacterized membrane protein
MSTGDIYIGIGYTFFIYLLLTIVSLFGIYFPPKEIGPYGYKTPRSMKNQANWDYGNALTNRLILVAAQLFLFFSLLIFFLLRDKMPLPIGISISTLLMILTIVPIIIITEYKLKQFEKSHL